MKLSDNEQAILEILRLDPFISQQDLAGQIGLSRSATANLLSGLQLKGYIIGKPYLLREESLITCVGGANIDYKLFLSQPHQPETSNPVISSRSFGGVIRNVAANLAQLDLPVSLMTLLGQDSAGDDMYADCKTIMKMFASERVAGYPTGTYTAVLDQAGSLVAGYADMAIADFMTRDWIERHRGHLRQGEWIVADCNMTPEAMSRLIDLVRQDGRQLAVITISEAKMKHLPADLSGVSILLTNLSESRAYFNAPKHSASQLAARWLATGLEAVVITNGVRPVIYGSAEGIAEKTTVAVEADTIKDVTGAGDAFSAATIYGRIKGYSLAESVRLGTRLAALTVQVNQSVRSDITPQILEERI